jgi:hypothetical protein
MTMKIMIIWVLMLLPLEGLTQKKAPGTIYIEYPSLNVVDAFTKVMVSGDTTAMSKLMVDDFIAFNPVTSTSYSQGMNKALFSGMVKWKHNNLDYYSLETMEGSYQDALAYAKDPSDNNAVTLEA